MIKPHEYALITDKRLKNDNDFENMLFRLLDKYGVMAWMADRHENIDLIAEIMQEIEKAYEETNILKKGLVGDDEC